MYFIGYIVTGSSDGLKAQVHWFDSEKDFEGFKPAEEHEVIERKGWHGRKITRSHR